MSGPAAPLPRRACAPRLAGRPAAAPSRPLPLLDSHRGRGSARTAGSAAGALLLGLGLAGCAEPPPPPPPLAPVAGAQDNHRACAECHAAEVAAWSTSRHATAPGGPSCAACHGGSAPGGAGGSAPVEAGGSAPGGAGGSEPVGAGGSPPADAAHAGLGPVAARACANCHNLSTEAPCTSCHAPTGTDGRVEHGLGPRFDKAGLLAALKVDFEPGGPATGPLLRVTNQGAPHPLPAGPGPRLRLSIEQLGQDHRPREGSTRERSLGGEAGGLAPGAVAELSYDAPIDERTTSIRARVEAWPDEGHRAALEARLREPGLVGEDRLATQAAFEAGWTTRFTVWELGLPVGDTPEPPATDPPKPGPPPGEAGAPGAPPGAPGAVPTGAVAPGSASAPRPAGAAPPPP